MNKQTKRAYISDRYLPDKAIDLIDEAAAHRDRFQAAGAGRGWPANNALASDQLVAA